MSFEITSSDAGPSPTLESFTETLKVTSSDADPATILESLAETLEKIATDTETKSVKAIQEINDILANISEYDHDTINLLKENFTKDCALIRATITTCNTAKSCIGSAFSGSYSSLKNRIYTAIDNMETSIQKISTACEHFITTVDSISFNP